MLHNKGAADNWDLQEKMSKEAIVWFIIKLHLEEERNCSKFQMKESVYNCIGQAA